MRKQTLIILVTAILGTLLLGGWLFFFWRYGRKKTPSESVPVSSPITAQISPSPTPVVSSQFELISDHEVVSPVFSEKMIYLFDQTEKTLVSIVPVLDVFKFQNLSEFKLSNVFSIDWSPDRKKVLIGFYRNPSEKRYAVFDLIQNLNLLLPDYVQQAVWSPDSKKLVIHHFSPARRESYFALLGADGVKEEKLLNLSLFDFKVFWLTNNQLIFYQKPAPFYPVEAVFNYDVSNKQLKTIFLPVQERYQNSFYGFDLLPSPDGNTLLFSLTDNSGAGLTTYLYSLKTDQLIEFPVKTLVQKCAFASSGESVYCAYSDELKQAAHLPFFYWQGKIKPNDSFARFNFRTGELKVYAEKTAFDAINLSVSAEQDYLLFVDRAEGKLYRMKLQ